MNAWKSNFGIFSQEKQTLNTLEMKISSALVGSGIDELNGFSDLAFNENLCIAPMYLSGDDEDFEDEDFDEDDDDDFDEDEIEEVEEDDDDDDFDLEDDLSDPAFDDDDDDDDGGGFYDDEF
jgi:hypothetical protein